MTAEPDAVPMPTIRPHSKRTLLLIAILSCLGFTCKARGSHDPLKVGIMAGGEERVATVAAELARQRYGLAVELVTFSDYLMPNAALADGSLDANAFQHRPFLDQQMADRGYELVVVARTFIYPIAGYSQRIHSLAELRDGAQVAVPNDPSNLGRALKLLEQQGLLELRPEAGILASVLDVTKNPRQLRIVELDAAQLPRVLPDVDLAIINNNYAAQAGLAAMKDGLIVESKDSPYVNLIVARKDNAGDSRIASWVKAYQTDDVHRAALEVFNGSVVKGW
jgi:D-methionine transport system substrate-binding protein